MTAVSPIKPEPEPQQASDAEGWALLEGLRRRLDDQAIVQRATQTQVTQLAESIGALVEQQRRRVRSLNLNSFVAYLIFTMLVGGGAYLLFRSRATELTETREKATGERDAAVKRADDATAKLSAREAAEAKAWEAYQLLETGKRADAKVKLAALAGAPVSRVERAVLDARARESQVGEVESALKAASASFKAGKYADVVAPLESALAVEPSGPRVPQMKYYLGVAFAKAGDLDKAIAMLGPAADGDQEDARFQLASALDRKGELVKARAEYDRFATAHPQSPLAVFAMRRSATLAHPVAPAPVIAPRPVAPVPPPPAPKQPETTRGESMSTGGTALRALPSASSAQTLPMAAVTRALALEDDAIDPLAAAPKKQAPAPNPVTPAPAPVLPAHPAPSPLPAPVQPSPELPSVPCTGSCIEIPQPPKAAPLPVPSPWLPPSSPEKPEPAPAPSPIPAPVPEPRPY